MTEYERGKWNMFSLLSSAWYGKGLYFLQYPNNGLHSEDVVYDRSSGKYMTMDEAIKDFVEKICCD